MMPGLTSPGAMVLLGLGENDLAEKYQDKACELEESLC